MHVRKTMHANKKGGHAHSQEMVLHSAQNLTVVG